MKQISVFVENKSGRVAGVLETLASANVNLQALSIADTADYGIMRMITDDVEKAQKALRTFGSVFKCTEVIAVSLDDRPGSLSVLLKTLAEQNISVSYMYAFVTPREGHAVVVLKVDKTDEALHVFSENGVSVLD